MAISLDNELKEQNNIECNDVTWQISAPTPFHPASSAANIVIRTDRKRRHRACLSCVRCHRLKVKCDKKEPCTRCRLSGWGKQCAYTHRVEASKGQTDDLSVASPSAHATKSGDLPLAACSANDLLESFGPWHSRHRGLSHFKELLTRLSGVAQVIRIVPSRHEEQIARQYLEEACCAVLPDNFPFSSPRAVPYTSLDKVHRLIETHRDDCPSYIDAYFTVFQPVHPIVDATQFMERFATYQKSPSSIHASWLSEFLMVLALGRLVVKRNTTSTVELCMASEACLAKTPFMVHLTIATVRTLCLIILAKLTINGTCWSFDGVWSLLGLIVRLAMTLEFQRVSPPVGASPALYDEWEAGQVLWSIILYFNIQVAMTTGMPTSISPDDLCMPPHMLPSTSLPLGSAATTWRTVMQTSGLTVLRIVSKLNSDHSSLSNEETLAYTSQIRQYMQVLDRIRGSSTLRTTIDMFFRRTLLILHRRQSLEVDAPRTSPLSYWITLECSLAMLVHQHDLCEKNSRGMDLLLRLHMLDLYAAAIQVSIYLLRKDAPLATGFGIPPRETIKETLKACTESYAKQVEVSPCFRMAHSLLNDIVGELEAS